MATLVFSRAIIHSARPVLVKEMFGCGRYQSLVNVTGLRLMHSSKDHPKLDIDEKVKENLKSLKDKDFSKEISNPENLSHFKKTPSPQEWKEITHRPGEDIVGAKPDEPEVGTDALPHPIWSEEDVYSVEITHKKPEGITDRLALGSIRLLRRTFDILTGFNKEPRTEAIWINRIIFLETVAGVPGMVAAMVRHLHSLRRMRRDHGWIHTLLEEAENERMHLMTAMCLKNPGLLFRYSTLATQGVFVTFFSLAYLVSPKYCHRFVGYLEEEAVVTYSKLLKDMDGGPMQSWNTLAAPPLSISYWKLKEDATMYDVILAIRADEAHHRVVNHTLGSLKPDDYNPYKPGQ